MTSNRYSTEVSGGKIASQWTSIWRCSRRDAHLLNILRDYMADDQTGVKFLITMG